MALLVVSPALLSYSVKAALIGRNRALEGSTQALSLIPGLPGQYLRRAFLSRALSGGCATSATIEFGTIFSQAGAGIDDGAYVGPRCHLGLVHVEEGALIAAGVHIPSGARTHGMDPGAPIKEQAGERRLVRVGAHAWIGSNAVVLADVGRNTIVGAGAVVVTPLPDDVVAAGVPARIVRSRSESASLT